MRISTRPLKLKRRSSRTGIDETTSCSVDPNLSGFPAFIHGFARFAALRMSARADEAIPLMSHLCHVAAAFAVPGQGAWRHSDEAVRRGRPEGAEWGLLREGHVMALAVNMARAEQDCAGGHRAQRRHGGDLRRDAERFDSCASQGRRPRRTYPRGGSSRPGGLGFSRQGSDATVSVVSYFLQNKSFR